MADSSPNPYASPRSAPEANLAEPELLSLRENFWAIIAAWEKLRLMYLAWLSLVGLGFLLLVVPEEIWRRPFFWLEMFAGFIGANICFTAGHVAEVALALLGARSSARRTIRHLLFVMGTVFATALTLVVMTGSAFAQGAGF